MKRIVWFAVILVAVAVHADQKVLMPFAPSHVYGAATVWWTFLIVDNQTDQPAVLGCNGCYDIPPQSHYVLEGLATSSSRNDIPAFLYLSDQTAESVQIAMRVLGSVGSDNKISALPMARAADFHSRPIHIEYVPVGHGARQSLRIYDRDGRDGTQVRLQILQYGTPVVDQVVTLREPTGERVGDHPAHPAWFEVNDLTASFPELPPSADIVDVVITPLEPDSYIWALFTSTENGARQFVSFVSR